MRAYPVVLIILIFFQFNLYSEKIKPKFRLNADFWSCPFFYENSNQTQNITFNGYLFGGVRINKFTIGAKVYNNYFSYEGTNGDNKVEGALNILKGAAVFYYHPLDWLELRWDLGGGWFRSALKYGTNENVGISTGSLYVEANSRIQLLSFFLINIINSIDLVFFQELPVLYFYGGCRFEFHPFIQWLNLYIEIGGKPFFYQDSNVRISTGYFVWSLGVSIDMTFKESFREKVFISNEKSLLKINNEIREIKLLKRAKEGDKVFFNNIKFNNENSDILSDDTIIILDKISDILIERKDITISLSSFVKQNLQKDKIELFNITNKREKIIVDYLRNKDITSERILNGYGILNNEIKISNDTIVIEILNEDKKNELLLVDNIIKIKIGEFVTLFPVSFKENSSNINESSKKFIDKLAFMLRIRKTLTISLEGYSILYGDPIKEIKLAISRAENLRDELVKRNILTDRIIIKTSGKLNMSNKDNKSIELNAESLIED